MLGFPTGPTRSTDPARATATPVFAENGMVSSAHPLVTGTGLAVLRDDGNAVDAAVAAGLVAAVVMPEMCGLGGDLFALIHRPGTDEPVSVQGSGTAPRAATLDQMRAAGGAAMPSRGPLSPTVPGMVHGYFTLLERFGTRGFADLVGPAVEYAEGHPISPVRLAYVHEFADLLRTYPASASTFLPDGAPPRPGSILRQPDLARTLRALADGGPGVFYEGEIAERITRALADLGGVLAVPDLAAHRTEVSRPLSTTYRGNTVYQTNLPSQGLIVLEALNIAERFDLPAIGVDAAERTHVLIEAIKLAFADRHRYCKDPGFGASPVEELISKEWAARRAKRIEENAATDVQAGAFDNGDTTYLCVVDGTGTMVSLIQSVSANFGSGIVAGDTGVVLNNRGSQFSLDERHPNVFAPGKKTMHTLNCYLLADPGGRAVIVGGTPGGDRQPQWNVQVLTGLIDGGLDVQAAIERPLWISAPTSAGATDYSVTLEARESADTVRSLQARGHRIELCGDWKIDSAAKVIARSPDTGVLCGGSDPRTEGAVLGY